jgi:hypothetical protein
LHSSEQKHISRQDRSPHENESVSDLSAELSEHFRNVHHDAEGTQHDTQHILNQFVATRSSAVPLEQWHSANGGFPERLAALAEGTDCEPQSESSQMPGPARHTHDHGQLEFLTQGVGGGAVGYEEQEFEHHEEDKTLKTNRSLIGEMRREREVPRDKARVRKDQRSRKRGPGVP